jgi:hypothetical protein
MPVIEFSIQQGDITSFDADVLALKYAQAFYGTDATIASLLRKVGTPVEMLRPLTGDFRYVETQHCIQARYALFVGTRDLMYFDYQDIRTFSARVLDILAQQAPQTRHLVMTIHGVGFGLDETEALLSQFAGYMDAMLGSHFPPSLQYITILDNDHASVLRLQQILDRNLINATYATRVTERWAYKLAIPRHQNVQSQVTIESTRAIESAGGPETKPHVFVAMPFKKEMDDIFYYGIQRPVREAGFLCERVDQEAFIGDILDQVKKKIETAALVIAELSGANPNVYLEVGYAWGIKRPTVLLVRDEQELRFDIRGQRCLKYASIRNLEETLNKELRNLKSQKLI